MQLLEEHLAKLEAGGSDNEDAGSDAGWDEWDQDSDAESDDSGGWNDVYSDDDEVEIDLSDSDDDEETQTRREKKRELQEKRKKALAGLATKEEVNEDEEESEEEEEKGMDAEEEEEGSQAGETADATSTAGDSVATTESRFSALATQKVRRTSHRNVDFGVFLADRFPHSTNVDSHPRRLCAHQHAQDCRCHRGCCVWRRIRCQAQAGHARGSEEGQQHGRGRRRGLPRRRGHPRSAQEGKGELRGTDGENCRGSRGTGQVWKCQRKEEAGDVLFVVQQGEEEDQAHHDGPPVRPFPLLCLRLSTLALTAVPFLLLCSSRKVTEKKKQSLREKQQALRAHVEKQKSTSLLPSIFWCIRN